MSNEKVVLSKEQWEKSEKSGMNFWSDTHIKGATWNKLKLALTKPLTDLSVNKNGGLYVVIMTPAGNIMTGIAELVRFGLAKTTTKGDKVELALTAEYHTKVADKLPIAA